MRAIIHWCLLPESLFTNGALLGSESNSKQCFYSVKAVCRVASKTKAQRSPGEVRFSSFIHSLRKSAAQGFCCGRSFQKALGGKNRTTDQDQQRLHTFSGRSFPKVTVTHSCTHFHWSALSTVVYAPGGLPRIPVINQPQTESNIKDNLKKMKNVFIWIQYSSKSCSRSFFLTYLFVLLDTVWFSLPKFSPHLM